MQSNISKSLQKVFSEFTKLNKISKALLKYGSRAALAVLFVGSLLIILNHTVLNTDFNLEFIARSIVKVSFTLLAEVVIGGLLLDYLFGSKEA